MKIIYLNNLKIIIYFIYSFLTLKFKHRIFYLLIDNIIIIIIYILLTYSSINYNGLIVINYIKYYFNKSIQLINNAH